MGFVVGMSAKFWDGDKKVSLKFGRKKTPNNLISYSKYFRYVPFSFNPLVNNLHRLWITDLVYIPSLLKWKLGEFKKKSYFNESQVIFKAIEFLQIAGIFFSNKVPAFNSINENLSITANLLCPFLKAESIWVGNVKQIIVCITDYVSRDH